MKRTLTALLLVLALMLTVVSGALAEDTKEPWEFEKFDPPITLTTDRWVASEEGLEEWNNRPYIVWCRENLGINWQPKFFAVDHADHLRQLESLAANDDMPDVIADAGDNLQSYYNRGLIRDLSADIEKWGSPLTKYIWAEYEKRLGDSAWVGKSSETSEFFCIPLALDPLHSGAFCTLYIRSDIVEDLGYDMPESFEQLEEIMEAYKNEYPDKYPFSATSSMYGIWGGCFSQVFSMHSANPGWFFPGEDGVYVYGSIQPEVKDALATLRKWYANGWIAPDFNNPGDPLTAYTQGEVFITANQTWFGGWAQPKLEKNISTARTEHIGFLTGTNGEVNDLVIVAPTGWPAAISTSCEHPEAVIWEMNVLFESHLRNDLALREMFDFRWPVTESQTPMNPEEVAAGKPARFNYSAEEEGPGFLNAGADNSPSIAYGNLTTYATKNNVDACIAAMEANDYDTYAAYESLEGATKTWFGSEYITYGEILANPNATMAKLNAMKDVDIALENGVISFQPDISQYRGFGLQSVIDYSGSLSSMEREYFLGIIKGDRPLDDFDQFVEAWKENGGLEMTKEINAYHGVEVAE